jgi:glycosyltransferase involved in cell wall biosynthesis
MKEKYLSKTAIVIFIYDSASKYFINLVNSINSQNFEDFEVVIFNDNVTDSLLFFKKLKVKYNIFNLVQDTPCGIRYQGFEILKDLNFDFYIFQDCDDELSPSRVRNITSLSEKYEIIVNDLDLINDSSEFLNLRIWKNRFINSPYFNFKNILNYNFMGLGNTSLHKNLLKFLPSRPQQEIKVLDWFIFYSILKTTLIKGYFTSSCSTLYRQHSENQIGIAAIDKLNYILEIKNSFNILIGLENTYQQSPNYKIPKKINNNFPFWWELN